MNRFKFTKFSIPGLMLIEPFKVGDERGFFMETFQKKEFEAAGLPTDFVQDNHSGSRQGILRGLHYQIRQPQGKLVRVVVGEVYDVAVDLRRNSPAFGKWAGVNLSAQNKNIYWVPPGFAHAFYVLSEWAEFVYKATDFYAPEWERTILWNDADLAIQWPLVGDQPPILSPKDVAGVSFRSAEVFDE